jgi:[glutamine synthetase] adenylyltransferase / [glutamine synthetase]-adenylyl-L-tyrosine phosphorylase
MMLDERSLAARVVAAPGASPLLPPRQTADAILRRELLERIEPDQAARLAAIIADAPPVAALLAGVFAHSPFLAQIMRLAPAALIETLCAEPSERLDALLADAQLALAEASDIADAMAPLRHLRRDMALLVALADIGGLWCVDEVIAALARTADAAVKLAIDVVLRQAGELGRITLADVADPGPGSGLVVLALGKHGAGELNYSSDIDLVLFFDPEAAEVAGIAEPATFYARLSRDLTKMLQERNADGYVFRVDLRLRPDPASTPPVVALPSAYLYYETLGQNWERAAFIKARAIAGDIALGTGFLKELTPFIWRKYLDYAAISDIHAMKRQIQAVKGHETIAVAGHDVKLGRGGIREIEFFVQTQQLVFGGRNPQLRGRRTLDMLAELEREGRISAEAHADMASAYRFLRTVEHRLQMRHDEQTQRLPVDEDDLDAFARFCGHRNATAFGKALRQTATTVERHYALLFEAGPSLAAEAGALAFTGAEVDAQTLHTISKLGFKDAATAAETVRGWHFGRRPAVTSARAREALTELTPALLVALGRTPAPDTALTALDRAFERMPAAVELLTLLRSNTSFLSLFAQMLGGAPRLAQVLSTYPHVLDGVIDPAFSKPSISVAGEVARIEAAIGGEVGEVEDFLDHLRDAVRPETFLVGARLLSGILTPRQAGAAWSAVAEAAIQVALANARRFFAREHGVVENSEIAILGLGRLGSRDLTASSDLDLIIIYDRPDDAGLSNGARPLDPVTYHIRLAQRFIAALTAPTRRGTLYDVDLRLKPDASKSPPATQLSSLVDYHRQGAETWELMALTKARVVAGDEALTRKLEAHIAQTLAQPRDKQRILADARAMRATLAREKGSDDGWDMKRAAGALTDLDFLAQWLVLTEAHAHGGLMKMRADEVIEAAASAGLVPARDSEALIMAWRLFDDITQWQRFALTDMMKGEQMPVALVSRMAASVGLPDARSLKAHLDETRAIVRKIVARLMA